MRKRDLHSVVWQEGKYYVSQCLNVEVSSFGHTKREALANLDEALELYFEDQPRKRPLNVARPEIVRMPFDHA